MRTTILILSLILLTACSPSEAVVPTAIAHTQAAESVAVALATDTPKPPSTPTSTITLGPTSTSVLSPTPNQTYVANQTQNAAYQQTANAPATWAALTPSATTTQTFTPGPTNTSYITQTAEAKILENIAMVTAIAAAFEATRAALTAPRGSGFYLVGVDIASGIWRSTAGHDDCYWARYDNSQNILDSHSGQSGGDVTIRTTDFQVEFDDCGTWEYISP
jgi:hypothetical protein